jgi:hypothetical protein
MESLAGIGIVYPYSRRISSMSSSGLGDWQNGLQEWIDKIVAFGQRIWDDLPPDFRKGLRRWVDAIATLGHDAWEYIKPWLKELLDKVLEARDKLVNKCQKDLIPKSYELLSSRRAEICKEINEMEEILARCGLNLMEVNCTISFPPNMTVCFGQHDIGKPTLERLEDESLGIQNKTQKYILKALIKAYRVHEVLEKGVEGRLTMVELKLTFPPEVSFHVSKPQHGHSPV